MRVSEVHIVSKKEHLSLRSDRAKRWWDRTAGVVLSGLGGVLLLGHG